MEMAVDLPDDCWALVFVRLGDESHMHPLSLVCRRFLAITNRLRSELTISGRAPPVVPGEDDRSATSRLFRRFPNVRRIAVAGYGGSLGALVREISRSGLRLEALDLSGQHQRFPRSAMTDLGFTKGGGLRSLAASRLLLLENDDVLAIAASFPNLDHLDISNPQLQMDHTCELRQMVTDRAIEVLSSNLRNLRSIRLCGNHFLSDNALVLLATNCPMLDEIVAHNCTFMKGRGMAFALRHSRNLTSVSVNRMPKLCDLIRGENSFSHARALRRLTLSRMSLPDDLLLSLGNADLPLLELSLSYCSGPSFSGLSSVLKRHGRTLRRLVLANLCFLSDEGMIGVIPHLRVLESINLSSCSDLSNPTFFSIVENCSCIEKIEMSQTNLGRGIVPADSCANRSIKSLQLPDNRWLDDTTIQKIAEVCPRLHSLDLTHCWEVTGEGMGKVGAMCRELTELSIQGCSNIKDLGADLGFLKLETLKAPRSGLEDTSLSSIALSCRRLLFLDLGGCSGVTQKGVKEVVKECRRLQQLHMGADGVDANALSWIVFSSPLLRKVVWQSGLLPLKLQDLFLRHGCVVATETQH